MILTDWKETFIRLVRRVTLDEAALVAASIDPAEVGSSVGNGKRGGFDNWQRAELVARLLREAVASGNIYAIEASVDTCQGFNHILKGSDLRRHMDKNPSHRINSATFQATDVWLWMARRGLIEPEYVEFHAVTRNRVLKQIKSELAKQKNARQISGPTPPNEQPTVPKDSTKSNGHKPLEDVGTASCAPDNKRPEDQLSDQVATLKAQVADLTERLQQAENEISELKAKTPTFRHMTTLLELVADVQERYWGDNWDRDDPDTKANQGDIIAWVRKDPRCPPDGRGGSSKNQATMVAVVAKPNT